MSELRQAPVYTVGTRTSDLMGADRRLVLMTGILAATMANAYHFNPAVIVISLVVFVVLLKVFQKINKTDSKIVDVTRRHFVYRKFYNARSTPFCVSPHEFK